MATTNELIRDLLSAGRSPMKVSKALNVPRGRVYFIRNKFLETGEVTRRPGSGRPRSAHTPNVIRSIKRRIIRNPVRSMRRMAKEVNVS